MKRWSWILGGGCLMAAVALAAPAPLATIDQGRGPTLLLLHAMGGTRETWKPTAEKLAGYHVVLRRPAGSRGRRRSPTRSRWTRRPIRSRRPSARSRPRARWSWAREWEVCWRSGRSRLIPSARAASCWSTSPWSAKRKDATQRDAILQFVDQNYRAFLRMTFGHLGRDSLQRRADRGAGRQGAVADDARVLRGAPDARRQHVHPPRPRSDPGGRHRPRVAGRHGFRHLHDADGLRGRARAQYRAR